MPERRTRHHPIPLQSRALATLLKALCRDVAAIEILETKENLEKEDRY